MPSQLDLAGGPLLCVPSPGDSPLPTHLNILAWVGS